MAEIHNTLPSIKRILLPTDGSEGAFEAAEFAADLVRHLGASITLIHVIEPWNKLALARIPADVRAQIDRELLVAGKDILVLTQKPFAEAGIPVNMELREGSPVDVIADVAAEGNYDLVVIGRRGTGKSSSWLLGSVSQQVVRNAPCPVLVA